MPESYTLGIDQGSSGSRAMILDAEGQIVGYGTHNGQAHAFVLSVPETSSIPALLLVAFALDRMPRQRRITV